MGTMQDHSIIVTSHYDAEKLDKVRYMAMSIFSHKQVSEVQKPIVNGGGSIFISPDGSKEGWAESAVGDSQRKTFIDWIDSQAYDDGSNWLTWVEVSYGERGIHTRSNIS